MKFKTGFPEGATTASIPGTDIIIMPEVFSEDAFRA